MQAAYHPDFGEVVNYTFKALPDHPDGQVAETIDEMRAVIRADAGDRNVQEDARQALAIGNGDPIAGVWSFIKPRIRFQQDADTAARLQVDDPRIADTVEVVIRPADQSRMIRMQGSGVEDCDGFETFAACLLRVLGVKVRLVTVAADPRAPLYYSHVYMAAYMNGRRVPLDFSHGPYPGWECPNLGRIREWDIDLGPADFLSCALPAVGIAVGAFLLISAFARRTQ